MSSPAAQIAAEILAHEAYLLDTRRWDEWLGLLTDDVVFWIPAWKSESETTESPECELSLMYLEGIGILKERVWRLRSGLSRASINVHRTSHVVGSVHVADASSQDELLAYSAGAVHLFNPETSAQHCFFGRYEHALRKVSDRWQIAAKRVTLMNDCIPTLLDFYSV